MMNTPHRMSPLTAFFLGLFGVGGITIGAATTVVLFGMNVVDKNATVLTGIVENTVADLPEFVERLPGLVDALGGRRVPGYVENLDVRVSFVEDKRSGGLRPVMAVTNNGGEVVSVLAVRVAALDVNNFPIREWTEVVATPLAFDDHHWRGPLLPGNTRHLRLSGGWRSISAEQALGLTGAVEIADIRLEEASESF